MTQHFSFAVTGLNCAGCARGATKALAAVEGVDAAEVNFATSQAVLSGEVSAPDLVSALEGAGYGAGQGRIRLQFSTLSCASCVARVREALLSAPGVLDAEVNLAHQKALVTVLDGTQPRALLEVARAAGYPAELEDSQSAPAHGDRLANEARRHIWLAAIAGILALPVLILEMGSHMVPAFHHWVHVTLGQQGSWTVQAVLTGVILAGPGAVFFRLGLPALWRRAPDMNALVALGTGAAWTYSMVVLLRPDWLPAEARSVYFEGAAVVAALILLGRALEARAKGRAGAAIEALLGLVPDTVLVLRDGAPQEALLEAIQPGDLVRILPGAQVPVDGAVVSGMSDVEEAMLTGEPLPVAKSVGAQVYAGTLNGAGALDVEVTRASHETALAGIIAAVETAQNSRLPVQDLVDRITAWFVPAVMAIAALAALAWWLSGGGVDRAVVAAVSVLIIACPCAMGLAVPMSLMVGTGRAAEGGILFRSGAAVQVATQIEVLGFDKTGTLTEGQPALAELRLLAGLSQEQVLAALAALEAHSEHPIAKAILAAAHSDPTPAENIDVSVGEGICGSVDGRRWALGNAALIAREGAAAPKAEDWEAEGKTVLYAACEGELAAMLAISDRIKQGAAEAIKTLQSQDIDVLLVSGDSPAATGTVAQSLGIKHHFGGLKPNEKTQSLKAHAAARKAGFVGDGINDAPVLASADLGIALGSGTDVAMESADVVLSKSDPQSVGRALSLAKSVMSNVRQNLFWAFAYNVALIPVAAGAFAWAGITLQPALAGAAMALSSLIVVTNALRLKRA